MNTSISTSEPKHLSDAQVAHLAQRFLTWPLPHDVCADGCATTPGYPNRCGTNLLNANQAQQMVRHVFGAPAQELPTDPAALLWIVEVMPVGFDAWRIRGVFTLQSDAEQLRDQLSADPLVVPGSATAHRLTYEALEEEIFKQRVGRYEPMVRLAEHALAGQPAARKRG